MADALEFKFTAGKYEITYMVPPVRTGVIQIYAYWKPGFPGKNGRKALNKREMAEYIAKRDAIVNQVANTVKKGARLPFTVTHDVQAKALKQ